MAYNSNVAQSNLVSPATGGDSLLRTKLFVPAMRANQVRRSRLVDKFNAGIDKALILVSAPAGFGKTTALAEWVAGCAQPVAWLSLDAGDNDPVRFWSYFIDALQSILPDFGRRVLGALRSPQPPTIESTLTELLNEIAVIPRDFVIVLDDYHCIESTAVDEALAFLLDHRSPHMHLVIATREDPRLPIAQLRTRGQLIELRIHDLRFTAAEAALFLNCLMGLDLSAEDIDALEARTEGWIAGLQLAAISMQEGQDPARFIRSFTGSHRFVLDYLVEEVLARQSADIQEFLLRTSILQRMCAPLCEALVPEDRAAPQATLEYLERANLFVVPLDDERRWYRYHHLFADLLRQRLLHSAIDAADLHQRASAWYEHQGFEIEAFEHAAAANDIERAARLLEGHGVPLHQRGGVMQTLKWLESLSTTVLDANPGFWVMWASALLFGGQMAGVEAKLQNAEASLQSAGLDDKTRDLHGQIAAARAMLAVGRYDVETIVAQAKRALDYLHSGNLSSRFRVYLALANGHEFRGEHAALGRAYEEALSIAQAAGNVFHVGVATLGVGQAQELANQLHPAAECYQGAVRLLSDQPPPILSYAYLGLARILYEWNDLASSADHLREGLHLALQYDQDIDVSVICEVLRARLTLARGDASAAAAILACAEQAARQRNFTLRLPEIAVAQVLVLLHQGNLGEAAALAASHDLSTSRARVYLAQGDPEAALATLEPYRQKVEAKGWDDECLRTMVVQAVALQVQGQRTKAVELLGEVLALAQPGGFIRIFIDEGPWMAELLSKAAEEGHMPDYARKLLAAFAAENPSRASGAPPTPGQPLVEPLSERELEVLRLIAQGLSNHEIGDRLFLALSTVKGHNRVIFNKLQVQRRTEAVARARELDLL